MNQHSDASTKELVSGSVLALRESRHDEAISMTYEIISREPDHVSAHAIQFSSLFKSGKLEQARQMGGKAAHLNPESVFILNNQACLQLEAKQPASAAGLLKSLIDQFGERGQWLYNLALAQRMVGNYEYSISVFQRTLDHQPDHDRAAFQLADCLRVVGRHEDAVRAYDYVRILRSKHAPSHCNFIHQAAVNGCLSRTDLKQELKLWEERFVPHEMRYNSNGLKGKTSLRIGFLLGVIPSSWLLSCVTPLINQLAQGEDSVVVYWHDEKFNETLFNDRVEIIKSAAMSDADFARQGRSDNIDVIIDVCGMRVGSRQRALGLQLASKELGWLAHEGAYATPLVTILDKHLGSKRFFVIEPTAKTKDVDDKVLLGIGCYRGLSYKVIKTWAELLLELPGWKLHLDAIQSSLIKRLTERFGALGVTKDRLIFDARLGTKPGSIVLDNFIENDPVSAANAVANGGILVCLKGELFPAQQSANLLHQFGRDEWICSNQARYMQRVVSLIDGAPAEPVTSEEVIDSKLRNLGSFVMNFRKAIFRCIELDENNDNHAKSSS